MQGAIKRNIPFVCLVPGDLVDRMCISPDGTILPDVREAVNESPKIAFLSSNLTWLIHGITIKDNYRQVYVNDRVTPEIELNSLM